MPILRTLATNHPRQRTEEGLTDWGAGTGHWPPMRAENQKVGFDWQDCEASPWGTRGCFDSPCVVVVDQSSRMEILDKEVEK